MAWEDCCLPKEEGGLGFRDLMTWNMGAVIFQLWRITSRVNSIWVDWLYSCILNNKSFWSRNVLYKRSWSLRNFLMLENLLSVMYRLILDITQIIYYGMILGLMAGLFTMLGRFNGVYHGVVFSCKVEYCS